MLHRIFRRRPAPLIGAPALRRLKTYSAESGYVYRYCYLGYRHTPAEGGCKEYCFDISAAPGKSCEVPVRVADAAVQQWETAHGRALADNERYAAAKMSLFQAFDERPPERMREPVLVRFADLEAILARLDLA